MIGALAAVAWIFFIGFAIWFLVRRYRRGYEVAVTGDGLIIRLPGYDDGLIPWANVAEVSVKETNEGKSKVASVILKDRGKKLDIGGVCNVFPKREDVERFVEQVYSRIHTDDVEDIG